MEDCLICKSVFGTKEINGVRQLQTFKGYTVDFRLGQFRRVPVNTLPEFIDFDSPEGEKLGTDMHRVALKLL